MSRALSAILVPSIGYSDRDLCACQAITLSETSCPSSSRRSLVPPFTNVANPPGDSHLRSVHAWGDSNLYLRRAQGALTIAIEHRAAAAPEPLALELTEGDAGGDTRLALVERSGPDASNTATDLDESIIAVLPRAPESGHRAGHTARR